VLNTPNRGLGDKAFQLIEEAALRRNVSFVEAARGWNAAGLDPKAGQAIDGLFQELFSFYTELTREGGLLWSTSLARFLENVGYRKYLEKLSANPMIASKRWRFVEIFAGILDRYSEKNGRSLQTLKDFLDAMELRDALASQEEENAVELLTLHACKGLEFETVFLIGVEDGTLPHQTLGLDLAEERRLFYVGITRAKKHLTLTRSEKAKKQGRVVATPPSRFLLDLPPDCFQEVRGILTPETGEIRKNYLEALYAKLDAMERKGV
jgi:superfamily I DNA/RNA helicase